MDLLTQPTLRANAEAVADDQHPHHQLGIDRRATRLAVVRLQMRPNLGQVDEPIDLAQQMIVGDMPFEAEAAKQRLLHHPPLAHHRPNLLYLGEGNQRAAPRSRSFSTKSVESECGAAAVGRAYRFAAPFVWRCLSGSTMAPFPHPSHRTGHADFPHPALGQALTLSSTARHAQAGSDVRARSARRDARVDSFRLFVA